MKNCVISATAFNHISFLFTSKFSETAQTETSDWFLLPLLKLLLLPFWHVLSGCLLCLQMLHDAPSLFLQSLALYINIFLYFKKQLLSYFFSCFHCCESHWRRILKVSLHDLHTVRFFVFFQLNIWEVSFAALHSPQIDWITPARWKARTVHAIQLESGHWKGRVSSVPMLAEVHRTVFEPWWRNSIYFTFWHLQSGQFWNNAPDSYWFATAETIRNSFPGGFAVSHSISILIAMPYCHQICWIYRQCQVASHSNVAIFSLFNFGCVLFLLGISSNSLLSRRIFWKIDWPGDYMFLPDQSIVQAFNLHESSESGTPCRKLFILTQKVPPL